MKSLSNETTVKSTNASKATSKSSAKSTTDTTDAAAETTVFKFLQEKFLQQLLAAKSSSKSPSKSSCKSSSESSKSTNAASETIHALVNKNFHSAQCSLLLPVNSLALHITVDDVDSMDIGKDNIIVVMIVKRLQSEVLQQLRY